VFRLTQKEYNLSSKYNFHFDQDYKNLTITENKDHINDLWSESIYDIMAIVGENGCGKSSVLEVLFSNSFGARTTDMWDIPIFIFEGADGLEVHKRTSFEVNIDPNISTSSIPFHPHFKYNEQVNQTTNIVYYSNLWDQVDSFAHEEDIFNISTSKTMARANQELFNGILLNQHEIYCHRTLEFLRQIDYVLNNKKKSNKYIQKLPDYISLKFIVGLKQSSEFIITDNEELKKVIDKYFDNLDSLQKEADLVTTARISFFTVIALQYINNSVNYKADETIAIWNYLSQALINKTSIDDIITEVIKLDKKDVEAERSISQIIEAFAVFEGHLKSVENSQTLNIFSIKIEDATSDLFSSYLNSMPSMPFLEFSWREMSSGEKGLLALLSRFQYLKSLPEFKSVNAEEVSKDMIILMDEVELYFHPNWQRKLVYILINEIASIFPSSKIQFIIASHSPFLVSDLPRNNVMFMTDDKEKGLGTVVEPTGLDHTFGSNIHELLANSFFMSSTIGHFALDTINNLVKYTKDEEQDTIHDDDKAQKLIDLIGEPIIRNKLQKMLEQKPSRNKQAQITYLRNQIDKLERE
jgi:predicted ATP-binding protein involved in virulence